MGAKVDLPVLFSNINNIKILFLIIVLGILAKVFGVGIVSSLKGFKLRESLALGLFHSARLSLIIAAVEIGNRIGLININLFSMFILFAMTSALFGPSIGKYILKNKKLKNKRTR